MKYSFFVAILLIITLSYSCLDDVPEDFDNPDSEWNPDFSLAVGYASLGMNDESGFDTLLLLINAVTGLPFWTEEVDIPLTYSMPFDMQQLSEFSEEIVSIMFRVNTYNGFPNTVDGQVYFLDVSNNIVDSLFSDSALILESGTVNGTGETINSSHNQTDIIFDQDKIDELSQVRNILIEGAIRNVALDTTLINYYPAYKFDLQLGVRVKLKMSLADRPSDTYDQ
ncbi:MAG: hypothetical protein KOO66_09540 [Bacteroidales bacterium]|nr:hypothetical protein [Bacteroidales bacterium]